MLNQLCICRNFGGLFKGSKGLANLVVRNEKKFFGSDFLWVKWNVIQQGIWLQFWGKLVHQKLLLQAWCNSYLTTSKALENCTIYMIFMTKNHEHFVDCIHLCWLPLNNFAVKPYCDPTNIHLQLPHWIANLENKCFIERCQPVQDSIALTPSALGWLTFKTCISHFFTVTLQLHNSPGSWAS